MLMGNLDSTMLATVTAGKKKEFPKSPVNIPLTQTAYWTTKGLSVPSCLLTISTSSGV